MDQQAVCDVVTQHVMDEAVADLRQAGLDIVPPVRPGDTGAWLHVRAPDEFVHELSQEW